MKRNKLFIAGLVTVFVALVSLTLVSSTWAKYTSSVEGTDTARVAKWAWNYKGEALSSSTSEVQFKLFETVKDTDGTAEGDVANLYGGITQLVAPGTQGSFEISFENESEVTANLKVTFSQVETSDIPLVFSFNSDFTESKSNISDLSWNQDLAIGSAPVTKTIYWKWDFNNDIDVDTNLGWKGTDTITVTMSVVFTQVD